MSGNKLPPAHSVQLNVYNKFLFLRHGNSVKPFCLLLQQTLSIF